jgi:Transposase and inactivated derivatives
MVRKSKVSSETKIDFVRRYLEGKTSISCEARRLGINPKSIEQWISIYESLGTDGLITKSENATYSSNLKMQAVLDYLKGQSSYRIICIKYGIRSYSQLRRWVLKYNGHERLKSSGTGGASYMTEGRKTTFDERVEIVQYCIAHEHDYLETSEQYKISYQQARNYTIKYESGGVEALADNRGKRKPVEQMTELEKLRAENKILRAEKERAEMETLFLKKLEEIERRRY